MSAIISIIFNNQAVVIVRFIDDEDNYIMTLTYREFVTWVVNAEEMMRVFLNTLVTNIDEQGQNASIDGVYVILRNN